MDANITVSGFAVEAACHKIVENGFRRVALQFPDEFLSISIKVYQSVVAGIHNNDVDVFIIGDSTFGSSVDDISAQHVDADVLLYFGSDLSSSGAMPVMIIPYQKPLDCQATLNSFVDTLTSSTISNTSNKILLLYEPGYHHGLIVLREALQARLDEIESMTDVVVAALPPCADLEHWVPGMTYSAKAHTGFIKVGGLLVAESVWTHQPDVLVWYVGEKTEQIVSINLQLSHRCLVTYSPASKQRDILVGGESKEFRERCGGFLRVKDAKIVGLIIGSMGMTGEMTKDIVYRLETLIAAAKKSSYVFVMGRLNEAKLCNFPEVDIFCLISNDDVALIKPKTFHKPVITPWELEVGLGARQWDGVFRTEASSVLAGDVSIDLAVARITENLPENPIDDDGDDDNEDEAIRRKFSALGSGTGDAADPESAVGGASCECSLSTGGGSCTNDNSSSTVLTTMNNERQLTAFSSAAADHFSRREFQGLTPQVPDDHDTSIQPGLYGVAAGYVQLTSAPVPVSASGPPAPPVHT